MMHFCTYFDGRYAPRALLMLRSLAEVFPQAEVSVLALDPRAAALEPHAPPGTRFAPLESLLDADAALRIAKDTSPTRGWLMELKPAWLKLVLATLPKGQRLTYVDADMFFLASPQEALSEASAASITLSPQRFSDPRGDAHWGRFNAGWIGLRRDATAEAFLEAWRLDCRGRMSPSYSNQKFLDRLPGRFPGLHVLDHPGVNLAHWNVAGVRLEEREGRVFVDGRPLLAYHMAGLFPVGFGRCVTSLRGRVLDGPLRKRVYEPYLRRLRSTAQELGQSPAQALDRVHWPRSLADRCRLRAALWIGFASGGAVRF